MNRRTVLKFSTHSFVDLITNSSTELFVCDSKKTVDAVKELLATLLKNHDAIEGESHSFEGVYGTIEATPFTFDWYKVSVPVQDAYKHYNRYCSFGRNPYEPFYSSSDRNAEEEDLQEDSRRIEAKHNVNEKGLYEKNKKEYERRYKAARKEIDALWTDYGARKLTSEKNLFIEFLTQNAISPDLIEEAAMGYDDAIERHRRDKSGEHAWFRGEFQSPLLVKANGTFKEWSAWGITAKKGDIFVYSASDNTIPYPLFDTIASYLNADRYHLG